MQILQNALAQELGRKPTDTELTRFTRALNRKEAANPTVTTTHYSGDGSSVSSKTKQGNVDPNTSAESFAKTVPAERNRFQDSQYLNVIANMIGGSDGRDHDHHGEEDGSQEDRAPPSADRRAEEGGCRQEGVREGDGLRVREGVPPGSPGRVEQVKLAVKQGWTAARLEAEIKTTTWWTKRTDAQRQADLLSKSNPAEWNRQIAAKTQEISQQASALGITLSAADAKAMASSFLTNGSTQGEIARRCR